MSGRASRRKGLVGEREVAERFRAAGFGVRGLEASGDWLCIDGGPRRLPPLHLECKRQERLRLPEWMRQASMEAPAGAVPIVTFRQNRGEWYAVLELGALLELLV